MKKNNLMRGIGILAAVVVLATGCAGGNKAAETSAKAEKTSVEATTVDEKDAGTTEAAVSVEVEVSTEATKAAESDAEATAADGTGEKAADAAENSTEATAEVDAASAATKKGGASAENGVDAISGASQAFYADASFDQKRLWEAIGAFEGSCTIATVNEDGTPNLIVAVPGTADETHLYFNWADNATKENVLRTGEAVISYYIYHPEAEEKMERNQGARARLSLETDEAVLKALYAANPACSEVSTVLKVEEILPLG